MAEIAACSRCGSTRIYPKIWFQGFLPTVNDERQTYVCRDCGAEGMLLLFSTEEERVAWVKEARAGDGPAAQSKPVAEAIPIVPLDAVPLLEVRGVDAIPIYRAKVVDVRWTDRRLRRGGYRIDVDAYWAAIGGPRYNAGRVFILDLAGVNNGNPNFDAVRTIAKRASVLLDLGVRDSDDVMDGFMVDAESVVVGTKTLESLERFREIRELSEGVIPCLDFSNGVVWSELSREDRDVRVVAAALHRMGFTSLAVMDLARLGTSSGPDPRLVSQLEGLDFDLLLGGGIREEDAPGLREKGIDRALVDPFTPVIRALLPTKEESVPTDALSTPRPKRDVRGAPAPG